jgi:hypothetical protein
MQRVASGWELAKEREGVSGSEGEGARERERGSGEKSTKRAS